MMTQASGIESFVPDSCTRQVTRRRLAGRVLYPIQNSVSASPWYASTTARKRVSR